jgi:2-polyprenyl-3-methyl-5-hydroxy-6-metoxy-1,4-benzoquinol methylase
MALGPTIRKLFGRYERQISEQYRSIYLDVDAFVATVQRWATSSKRILEVGCGEGAVTERLAAAYPDAKITAIDITPRVGRLYAGPRSKVTFLQSPVQEIAATEPHQFDLVVLSDVMHHVPEALRQDILDAIRDTLAPGGVFVFKDWERKSTLIHWMCFASDRWLTGDHISYMTRDEMRERLARSFGRSALAAEARIAPWRHNLATLVRP